MLSDLRPRVTLKSHNHWFELQLPPPLSVTPDPMTAPHSPPLWYIQQEEEHASLSRQIFLLQAQSGSVQLALDYPDAVRRLPNEFVDYLCSHVALPCVMRLSLAPTWHHMQV